MEATIPDRPAGTVDGHGWPPRRIALGLFLFAAGLRVPTLPLRRLVEGDGVHYAQLARAILAGDLSGLANPYWSNLWPAVIAIVAGATDLDVVAAGRLASLLSGVLLALLTAVLAARLFDPVTGLVAGLLCAGHPWLVHFSTLVFTESFFALLLVALLLSAPAAPASVGGALRAGLFGGLAVVTRPEAYAAAAVVLVWIVAGAADPRDRARVARRAAVFAAVVTVFVFGRALVVHRYFGVWDFGIGTKGTANLLVGLAENDREMERVTTEAAADGTNALSARAQETSVAAFVRAHPARFARHVVRNLRRLAASTSRVFPPLPLGGAPGLGGGGWGVLRAALALAAAALATAGLVRAARGRPPRRLLALIATIGVLYQLGLAPLFVHDRLVVPLVPLFVVFLAAGLVAAARRHLGAERTVRWTLGAGCALLAVLSFARTLQSAPLDYAGDPVVQRETGEWLAARYGQDTRLMTAAPSVGFYFYDARHAQQEATLPWADSDRILAIARDLGVTVLAVPEWHLRALDHPAAAVLLHPEAAPPDLRHVVTLGEEAAGRMFVYEVRPAAAPPSTPP
jgi:4-amino-4-deoxy-L-arabinose transferase-like glycosyltransferase